LIFSNGNAYAHRLRKRLHYTTHYNCQNKHLLERYSPSN